MDGADALGVPRHVQVLVGIKHDWLTKRFFFSSVQIFRKDIQGWVGA